MKNSALLLLLFVVTGFSGLCSPPADEDVSPPSLQLTLETLSVAKNIRDKDTKKNWKMIPCWAVSHAPGWKIDWCEDKSVRVRMEDSKGKTASDMKVPDMKCHFLTSDDKSVLMVESLGWMPSAGAQWVRMNGEVSFAVSREEAEADPVTVNLVEGASSPLVLKGGGLGKDGSAEDVEARIVVSEYRDALPAEAELRRGKKLLRLEVEADVPLSIRGMELQTTDGIPLTASEDWECGRLGGSWDINPVEEGKLRVLVRHSQNLRRCKALMDSRISLVGLVREGNGKEPVEGKPEKPPVTNAACIRAAKGERPATAELAGLILGSDEIFAQGADHGQMVFFIEAKTKAPAVFGRRSDLKEQSLEVTDSTGRTLTPAVFDLYHLSHWRGRGGNGVIGVYGKCLSLASPGAEWLRVRGTLRLPVAVMRESPVYELPLMERAELRFPIPGAENIGEWGGDIADGRQAPSCCLKLEDVKELKKGIMMVSVSLEVEGGPFDLERFELVDGKGEILKNAGSEKSANVDTWGSQETQRWYQNFELRDAEDVKSLRVRLKYRTGMKMVNVPVDDRIGLGGPVPQKTGRKKP